MHTILKRTWAEIDLDRLRHNWETIRRVVHKETRMMAVVKADAYGHGAVTVSRVLDSLGADCFAVSNLDEAIQLRDAGIKRPILICPTPRPPRQRHWRATASRRRSFPPTTPPR